MSEQLAEMVEGPAGGLFVRSWLAKGVPRATVAICHGFNAHSGMYRWAGRQFAENGLTALAVDLRGRGRSEGRRFYAASIDDYVGDLRALVALAQGRHPGVPVFLLGHSAGAVVCCIYALDYGSELAGLVCESIAFRLRAPSLALTALKTLGRVAPHVPSISLKNRDFSRDASVVIAMNADPLIANERQPLGVAAALIRASERLKQEWREINLPLLIIHGEDDKVAEPQGSQTFYDLAGSRDKTLKLYEGRYHDPLNDLGKEEVMADIISWMRAH